MPIFNRFAKLQLFAATFFCLTSYAALVPYFGGGGYSREEQTSPIWPVWNSGQPSVLYLNGVEQSREYGTNDLNMAGLWTLHHAGVTVGMVDQTEHGNRVQDCIRQFSPYSFILRYELHRWDAVSVADGLTWCVNNGAKVVCITMGYDYPDLVLSNALVHAYLSGVAIMASLPDANGINIDTTSPDYPYSWNFPHVLGFYSTDRNGQMYFNQVAVNGIGAPGRLIVAAGTYSSGNTYAAAISSGCAAIVWDAHPDWTPATLCSVLRSTSDTIPQGRRLNPLAAYQFTTMGK